MRKYKGTVGWLKSKKRWATLIGLIVICGSAYFVGVIFHLKWPAVTGFDGKTWWDWLDLLFVPIILSFAAYFLNREQKRTELAVENIRNQNKILDEYIERISKLILDDNFSDKENNKNAKSIARTWTITALSRLDMEGKKVLLQFLDEAGLVHGENVLVNLRGADLVETDKTYFAVFSSIIDGLTQDNTFAPFAKISDSTISDTSFRSAVIYKGSISRSTLKRVIFSEADLREIKIYESTLEDSDLSNSLLAKAEIYASSLENVNLFQADLRNTTIKDSAFDKKSQFAFSNLTAAKFFGSNLREANFARSNLNFAEFHESSFDSAILSNTTMVGTIIDESGFENSDLTESNLSNSVIRNTSFKGAILRSSVFSGASLRNIDFSDTNLIEANFSKVDLTKVNLKNADLTRADLTGAKLRRKQIQDVKSLFGATLPNGEIYIKENG
ncbi:MAG: hypothetical protein EHM20_14485 [Alphaproteobacteria bacterium]|nr:MAG: hypothetical protein EHM20_14485 [Alphaproteobacteria bacterium]